MRSFFTKIAITQPKTVQFQKFCINLTTIICPSYDNNFSTNMVIKDCFSGGSILKTFKKQTQFQYLKPFKVKYLSRSSTNRFKVTHPWKATGNTLLMVYDTCLFIKIFTFRLPGKCGRSKVKGQRPGPVYTLNLVFHHQPPDYFSQALNYFKPSLYGLLIPLPCPIDQPRLRKENKKAEGEQREQIHCRIIAS